MPRDPYWTLLYRLTVLLQPDSKYQEASRVPTASALLVRIKEVGHEYGLAFDDVVALAEGAAWFLQHDVAPKQHATPEHINAAVKQAWDLFDHTMRHFRPAVPDDGSTIGWESGATS